MRFKWPRVKKSLFTQFLGEKRVQLFLRSGTIMQPKSLCFLEASQEKEKGNITWEQYIHNLVIHCTAKNLHSPDVEWWKRGTDWELLRADPFAYSVMTWTRQIRGIKGMTFTLK